MAVTIKDVAGATGLDSSTVSRGLRDDPRVRAATVARIKAAAEELGYVPNLSARSLVTGKTNTVWFLHTSYTNSIETLPVDSAGRALAGRGLDLLSILYRGESEALLRQLRRLKQGLSDAAIIIPVAFPLPEQEIVAETLRMLRAQNTPVIALDREVDGIELPIITTDNALCSARHVAEALAFGCTNFIVSHGTHNSTAWCRQEVAEREVQAAGFPVTGLDSDGRLIGRLREGSVAIFESTQGGFGHIVRANMDVLTGRDLFFGVFDTFCGDPWPASRVVVVEQDFETIGRLGGQLILDMLAGNNPAQRVTRVPAKAFHTIESRRATLQDVSIGS